MQDKYILMVIHRPFLVSLTNCAMLPQKKSSTISAEVNLYFYQYHSQHNVFAI